MSVTKGKMVLIVRPQPGATRTAQKLLARGHTPVICPLSETTPLGLYTLIPPLDTSQQPMAACQTKPLFAQARGAKTIEGKSAQRVSCPAQRGYQKSLAPQDLAHFFFASSLCPKFGGLIASSAAAFWHLDPLLFPFLQHLPLYCVGRQTRFAAQAKGFAQDLCPKEQECLDAEKGAAQRHRVVSQSTLLIPLLEQLAPQHLLYLAGRRRRPLLEEALTHSKHILWTLEVYDTKALKPDFTILARKNIDAVLISSAFSAILLAELRDFLGKDTKIYCFSERIAKALAPALRPQALVLKEKTEEGLENAFLRLL